MRYYIIAGEASGDLHGSNLVKGLKNEDPECEFRFWGGDLMQAEGGEMAMHYSKTAFMGIKEVLSNLDKIKANLRYCKSDIEAYNPDVLILIDYPGFNLRIAEFAHKMGLKVFYYISPKIWAWNTGRVSKIKKYVDRMYTILPFETEFYKKHNVPINYVGNPVLDAIDARPNKAETVGEFTKRNGLSNKPMVALLAGSRKQELNYILPTMLSVVESFPEYQFVIAGAPSFSAENYQEFVKGKDVSIIFDQTYELVQHSQAALVTSGTATLETALLDCPQVVCYKMWGGKWFYAFIKKFILKIPFVSLVNLVLNKEGVKELIQDEYTTESVTAELKDLLHNQDYRIKMFISYNDLHTIMGRPGSSAKAAKLMVQELKNN